MNIAPYVPHNLAAYRYHSSSPLNTALPSKGPQLLCFQVPLSPAMCMYSLGAASVICSMSLQG